MSQGPYNFCAGPAQMPVSVIGQCQAALSDFANTGLSILSVSHRSKAFVDLMEQTRALFAELLTIPSDYQVLLLQGGASLQFAAIPQNLCTNLARAAYIDTGIWSRLAIKEAQKFCSVDVLASGPKAAIDTDWALDQSYDYLHCTPNETIDGIAFDTVPKLDSVPIVADMSSCLMSGPIEVNRYSLIYAGTQKNLGPAGLTVVIVREDLLDRAPENIATQLQYRANAKADSILNTPPTFAVYALNAMLEWLGSEGGLSTMAERNSEKTHRLYGFIDASDFYSNPVDPRCRSKMNIPFASPNETLDALFLQEAEVAGLLNLKGHRLIGGMRASLYNAVELVAVEVLVDFMKSFEAKHG